MNGSKFRTIRMVLAAVGAAVIGAAIFYGCSQMAESTRGEGKGWQIVIKRCEGQYSDQRAAYIYESVKQVRGIDTSQLRKTAYTDSVVVSYGHYTSLDDPAAKKDLKFIKSLMVPEQGFPFYDAHFEPISEPDPPIDPQWVLTRTKGYWTLQIAQFHGENRKLAAVQVVQELRNQGVPAYVQHGPIKSIVTIGSYREKAAREPSPNAISQDLKPVDPDLKKWKSEYPYLIINSGYGKFRQVQGKGKATENLMPSVIIRIPRPGASLW